MVLAPSGNVPFTLRPLRKPPNSAVTTPVPVACVVSNSAAVVPSTRRVTTVTPPISVIAFFVIFPVRLMLPLLGSA